MFKRPPGEFADPAVAAALAVIAEGVEALRATGLSPADCRDASRMFDEVETLGRRLGACQVDVLADVDARSLFTQDLAGSAKVLMRHRAKLSAPEASARNNVMRCLRDLPAIQEAYRQGLIAEPNIRRLSSTWGNERVRAKLIEDEFEMLRKAAKMVHPQFCKYLAGWERLADEDGARNDDQTTHEKRKANMVQNFDKGFSIEGQCGQLQGVMMREIWEMFTQAEFKLDWAKAVEKYGEGNVTVGQLERTDTQRRMDALAAIFDKAASTPPSGSGPKFVLNIVMDWATYQRELARLAGIDVASDDPNRPDFQCRTLDGTPLNPTEVTAASLLGHVRRIVFNSSNVAIDMGRESRLFTGPAAIAAKIGTDQCYWPTCWVQASNCQVDHLDPYNGTNQGRTDQANSGPLCGKHNRLKQTAGFTTYRDDDGRWHVLRPDGTEVEP